MSTQVPPLPPRPNQPTDALSRTHVVAAAAGADWAESLQELREREPAAAERAERAAARMPGVGDRFLNFTLIGELGRGAFGRVFLATQADLAQRRVAVKITANLTGEPQKLAQLQHTNIVPVYSVHHLDPIEAVVMPYLGATTLAHVLGQLRSSGGPLPSSGRYVLSTLSNQRSTTQPGTDVAAAGEHSPGAKHPDGGRLAPPRAHVVLDLYAHLSYVNAVLWIGARLADGLAHAHERGILHRDLKPANVLLTDEGQPMLLDFNLAEDTKRRGGPSRVRTGGTLPYMAPEQLATMLDEPGAIDERSDLYALGLILFELLTGRYPFARVKPSAPDMFRDMLAERRKGAPSPRRFNAEVSPAVDAIVRQLLDPRPERRYQRAADLQEDITRHLANRPLRHAAEPSSRERFGKWRRRNPRLATGLLVGLAALVFLILPATVLALRRQHDAADQRRLETLEAQDVLARVESDYRDVHAQLTTHTGDRRLLESGLAGARSILDRYGVGRDPAWAEQPLVARLAEPERARLSALIGELLLLSARGEYRLADDRRTADPAGAAAGLRAALGWNERAEAVLGGAAAPRSLWKQRADLLRAAGDERGALDSADRLRGSLARSDYDQYLEAEDLAAAGDYRPALEKIEAVIARNPTHFAAWFVQGLCHDRLGNIAGATESYSVCIALQPASYWAWFNRGVMRLRQGDYRRAEADNSRALELKPASVEAWINRGLARFKQRKLPEAESDLTFALSLSDVPTRIYFLRALVRESARDMAGAAADRAEGMRRTPTDSLSWNTRGFARMQSDPKGALADFNAALELNPRSRDALMNKANVLVENLHEPEAALQVYARFLELYPDDLDAHGSRGVILARQGQVEAARREADFCLQHADSSFVRFQMAGLYAQLSRHTHSTEDRRWALHLLAMALRKGMDQLDWVATDPDLEPVRGEPEYKRLAELARDLAKTPPPGRP